MNEDNNKTYYKSIFNYITVFSFSLVFILFQILFSFVLWFVISTQTINLVYKIIITFFVLVAFVNLMYSVIRYIIKINISKNEIIIYYLFDKKIINNIAKLDLIVPNGKVRYIRRYLFVTTKENEKIKIPYIFEFKQFKELLSDFESFGKCKINCNEQGTKYLLKL